MEAILWKLYTSATWLDIHQEFCTWLTAYNHFNRWVSKGLWDIFLVYEVNHTGFVGDSLFKLGGLI